MADTRLQAVATADIRGRTLFAGDRNEETAVAGSVPVSSLGAPAAPPAREVPGIPFFVHTFQPLRPTSVRAGIAARQGHPRQGQPSRTGLFRRCPVHALGATWQGALREDAAHTLWKVPMGADRDPSSVEVC
jgi:hypothetical protein